MGGTGAVRLGELCRADEVNSVSHSPCWNAWMRARQSGLDKVRVPGARCKSIRGRRIHHARTESASVSAFAIRSNAKMEGRPESTPEEKRVVFGTDSFCCGGWQAKESRLCSAWRMCGSSWPVVALCPGGGCVCAGMGAGPGFLALPTLVVF